MVKPVLPTLCRSIKIRDKMKALILTEGGKSIGYGHITRCLAFYHAFEEKGIKPDIIVCGDDSVKGMLRSKRYKILNWLKARTEVLKTAREMDIILVDSYLADLNFYKKISIIAKLPVYIDDNMRINYPPGVVINSAAYAEKIEYPERDGVFYLLGSRYAPLRKEFLDAPRKRIRKHVKTVLVTFGGCDPMNVTPKVLKLLAHKYPGLNKDVVISRGFKYANKLKNCGDENTRFIYDPNADTMKELMIKSDITISAGGQTLYELARMGVPSIVITVAENQMRHSRALSRAGVIEHVGCYKGDRGSNDKIMKKLKAKLDLVIFDKKLRSERCRRGKKIVDGRGVHRAVKKILAYIYRRRF